MQIANRVIENLYHGYGFSKVIWWSIKITCNYEWHIPCNGSPHQNKCVHGCVVHRVHFRRACKFLKKKKIFSKLGGFKMIQPKWRKFGKNVQKFMKIVKIFRNFGQFFGRSAYLASAARMLVCLPYCHLRLLQMKTFAKKLQL